MLNKNINKMKINIYLQFFSVRENYFKFTRHICAHLHEHNLAHFSLSLCLIAKDREKDSEREHRK